MLFDIFGLQEIKALRESMKDTNEVINIFWSFKKPISAIDAELIKDCAMIVEQDPKAIAIQVCRYGFDYKTLHMFSRFVILGRKDIETARELNLEPYVFLMSRIEKQY